MATVGERLRSQRELRGKTIEEIAEATGVGIEYLRAMEADAFDHLPGRAFGKLYVRAYAEVLGFDPRPLIEAYDREAGPPAEGSVAGQDVPLSGERPVAAAIARWKAARIPAPERVEPPVAIVAPDSAPEPEPSPAADAVAFEPAPEPPPPPVERGRRGRRLLVASLLVAMGIATFFLARRWRGDGEQPRPIDVPPATASAPPTEPVPIAPAAANPVPAPAPSPPEPPRSREPRGALSVPESGVGRRVVDSRLEGAGDRFVEGESVTFQTRVLGGTHGGVVRHVWIFEGKAQQSISLRLGGTDWRTHSTKTLYKTGAWSVEARDERGAVLARSSFVCEPRPRR